MRLMTFQQKLMTIFYLNNNSAWGGIFATPKQGGKH